MASSEPKPIPYRKCSAQSSTRSVYRTPAANLTYISSRLPGRSLSHTPALPSPPRLATVPDPVAARSGSDVGPSPPPPPHTPPPPASSSAVQQWRLVGPSRLPTPSSSGRSRRTLAVPLAIAATPPPPIPAASPGWPAAALFPPVGGPWPPPLPPPPRPAAGTWRAPTAAMAAAVAPARAASLLSPLPPPPRPLGGCPPPRRRATAPPPAWRSL